MINHIKKLVVRRKKTTIVLLIALVLVYLLFLHHHEKSGKNSQKARWITVQPRQAVIAIHKYGKIATSSNFSVIAPFDGKILKIYYHLGDRVKKGQKLLVLSKESIMKKQHQAQSDFLQKKEDYQKYLHWDTGSEVQKAKQDVLNAEQQLKISNEKLRDDEFLYKKGIISRDEIDQQRQTVQQNQQQISSAKLSLEDTMRQGDKDNLLIKRLAMEDAQNTLDTINKQIARAIIISPATGIALKPTETAEKDSTSFVAVEGEAVSENQNLLTIGNSGKLDATGSLNQEEINKISVGMPVTITSDAFPGIVLKGTIQSISQLADQNTSSSPAFPFTVALDNISAKERRLMRVGLMVDIALETYRNNHAIVVPVSAIETENGRDDVWVRSAKDGRPVKQVIERGPSLPEGIVVKKGLKAGDQVKVNVS